MSSTALAMGASVGALLGLLHATGVYATRLAQLTGAGHHPVSAHVRAAYGAVWTLTLWSVFGSYVLFLWLLSVPIWLGSRVAKAV